MHRVSRRSAYLGLALVLAMAWSSCRTSDAKPEASNAVSASQQKSLERHVQADSVLELRYASGYGVAWRSGLPHVYVASQDSSAIFSEQSFHYILLPKARASERSTLEKHWPDAQILLTPIQQAALVSTTHAALFCALDAHAAVVGLAWSANAYDPGLRARAKAGLIKDLGLDADVNLELVVDLEPDLVMTYTTSDPAYGAYAKMQALGLPVMLNGEFREAHPLGQAEWLRIAGLLLDRSFMADTLYAGVVQRYQAWMDSAALYARQRGHRPMVFTGMSWQGQWTVPEGQSFAARYLLDAGAAYPWSNSKGQGSLFLNVEQVMDRALDADLWLHPGAARSLGALKEADARVRHFQAFSSGRVYNNDARLSPGGGNDYWESAVVRPDRVLRDLVRIFYGPEERSGTDVPLYYYRRLPAE
jgi:iron complex transport system substrate-binding protein